jgi:hypothetical protein
LHGYLRARQVAALEGRLAELESSRVLLNDEAHAHLTRKQNEEATLPTVKPELQPEPEPEPEPPEQEEELLMVERLQTAAEHIESRPLRHDLQHAGGGGGVGRADIYPEKEVLANDDCMHQRWHRRSRGRGRRRWRTEAVRFGEDGALMVALRRPHGALLARRNERGRVVAPHQPWSSVFKGSTRRRLA